MKAKLILSVLVLGLASNSFGLVVGDFEDGSSDGWWNSGSSATPVTPTGATLGAWSMKSVRADGGWGGTIEAAFLGNAEAMQGLTTVGTVKADITTFAADFPAGYGTIALLVNAGKTDGNNWWGTMWNTYDWQSLSIGQTVTMTFQLPQAAMATLAEANGWANIGFINWTPGTESYIDPITGERVITYQGLAVIYFDNIQIIPEPASLALLGLGSLSLLRRKR